jgi:hypothetical protein
MKFKKLIEDILGEVKKTRYKEYERETNYIKKFNINGLIYTVEATVSEINDKRDIQMEIKFKLKNNPLKSKIDRMNFNNEQQYKIALQNSEIGITGTGNQFKVFSDVASCVAQFSDEFKPKYITFESDVTQESRIKLYNRLVKYLIKDEPYKECSANPLDGSELPEGLFYLERI